MARFYASIQGNRGEATRMGTPVSGISGHIRGWNIGARVSLGIDNNGEDRLHIYLTPGSNGAGPRKLIWQGTRADYDDLVGTRKE